MITWLTGMSACCRLLASHGVGMCQKYQKMHVVFQQYTLALAEQKHIYAYVSSTWQAKFQIAAAPAKQLLGSGKFMSFYQG